MPNLNKRGSSHSSGMNSNRQVRPPSNQQQQQSSNNVGGGIRKPNSYGLSRYNNGEMAKKTASDPRLAQHYQNNQYGTNRGNAMQVRRNEVNV